jgi:predicted AlkP superfamily pyrophosphatase or phosphodiesterase
MLFMRGFLLTRKEISTKSTWTSEAYLEYSDFIDHYQSSMEPSKKVFLFIIDALRKDLFTSHHFPHTFEMLRRDSSKAHVFGFLADPPTTTSQRLKAMTTGTVITTDFT